MLEITLPQDTMENGVFLTKKEKSADWKRYIDRMLGRHKVSK